MEERIPSRLKIHQLNPYDGIANLLDHLESYIAFMMIKGAIDTLLCLAFLATLYKVAQVRYFGHEPKSIHSFR